MRKIFLLLFLFFFSFGSIFAYDKPRIITREEWGADENYTDSNSEEWKRIYKKRAEDIKKPKTKSQLEAAKKNHEKIIEINNILMTKFRNENEISGTLKEFNGRELVWPIEYSKKVRAIVVHHTDTTSDNPYRVIKDIYRYHALNRGWGDIGYNFLIGENGEIFEGRLGGETSVGAHTVWNNRQTIGISLIGRFNDKPITKAQYDSLYKLIKYLVEKYQIDVNIKQPFNKKCIGGKCSFPIETDYLYPIIGHRDAGHTDCPGEELYKQLIQIRKDISASKPRIDNSKKQMFYRAFERVGEKKLLQAMPKIEKLLENTYNKYVYELKLYIIKYFSEKYKYKSSYLTNEDIKIKLSYPEELDYIDISDGMKNYHIEKSQNGKIIVDGRIVDNFSVKSILNPYVEITSWDRTPVWDKEKKYKDNKFRGEIFVYQKDGKLIVVNILKIENYLKGLGEISNSEDREKAEAVIISARTYALWYVLKDRKFPGEFYDGSDNPDIFQKYLGYDLELRSPNLNKVVDDTRGVVLKYNGEIIKPWYFSVSNGKTLSFYDYCINNKNTERFCREESKKYPFLMGKEDLGGIGKIQNGHGVGLPGTGATYFSSRGWPSSMILKYFYEGIEI